MLYHDDFDDEKTKFNPEILPISKFDFGYFFYCHKITISIVSAILAVLIMIMVIFSFVNNDENNVVLENNIENTTILADEENPKVEIEIVESAVVGRALLAPHSLENLKTKFLPRQLENPKDTITQLYLQDKRHVYLTFDDGPTAKITPQILDILKEENVPATFFVLGSVAERNPNILKRAYEEGHYIANHGYSHNYKKLYDSAESVWEEYTHTEQIIKNCIGNQNYNSYLFRFPGGSSGSFSKVKQEAKELFEERKVANVNWNALSGDAEGAETREEQLEYIKTTSTEDTIILLMHDASTKQVTVDSLRDIIKFYRDSGYEFKNFYEIF